MPMSQDFSKYQEGDPPIADDLGPDVIVSPDTQRGNRLPPGQARTRKWPVLQHASVPSVTLASWKLEITGLVDHPLSLSWDAFRELPRVNVFADCHCVTRWSRLGNLWQGVSTTEVMQRAGVRTEGKYIIVHGYDDGWTTNLSLDDFLAADALFADTHDGAPVTADHGGPLRLVIPRLYAWKSAKWVRAVEVSAINRSGFWEQAGYHDRGDPWAEERYSW